MGFAGGYMPLLTYVPFAGCAIIDIDNRLVGVIMPYLVTSIMAGAFPAPQAPPKRSRLTEKGRALWTLALFSPIFAELMSGSSPPLEFFFPLNFAFLLGLYGAGVLIMRELAVIWDKGWPSIILLGAAYGILEEGIAVKSFFDPGWMDLGNLGVYGRVIDTNWVWAFWLTIFHSVISISLPIIVINLMYPQFRKERFLVGRSFWIVIGILFIDVIFIAGVLNPYSPNPGMYALCMFVMVLIVLMAKLLPRDFLAIPPRPGDRPGYWSPIKLSVLAFAFILGSFVTVGAINEPIPYQVSIMVLLMLSAVVFVVLSLKMPPVNNRVHMAYFASGLLGFMVFLGLVLGMGGAIDMAIVAIVTAVFIWDFTRWSKGLPVRVFKVRPFVVKN